MLYVYVPLFSTFPRTPFKCWFRSFQDVLSPLFLSPEAHFLNGCTLDGSARYYMRKQQAQASLLPFLRAGFDSSSQDGLRAFSSLFIRCFFLEA